MARSFSATNDRVNQGTTAIPTTGTMFFWFYPTFSMTDGVSYTGFRVRNQAAVDGGLALFDVCCKGVDNNLYSGWFNPGFDDDRLGVAASSCLTQNAWNSVLMDWQSGVGGTFYTNGTSRGSLAGPATWNTSGHDRMIGNDEFSLGDDAGGRIAEFALWNTGLGAGEIAALAGGICPLLVRPASLTDYLPLVGRTSPEVNWRGGSSGAVTGATVADHPRVSYPQRKKTYSVPAAAPAGGVSRVVGRVPIGAGVVGRGLVA